MNTEETRLVHEVIAALAALSADDVDPRRAWAALPRGADGGPHPCVELVWEGGRGGMRRQYDAIVRLGDGATISLAVCPPENVPWAMRGARRFDDADLLRVNSHVITVGEAIAHLEGLLADRSLSRRLVDACLVKDELARRPVDVTPARYADTFDAFRRTHGLWTADDCEAWMTRRGLSEEQFLSLVQEHAELAVLRRRETEDAVSDHVRAHRSAFDRVRAVRVLVDDVDEARILRRRLAAGARMMEIAQARFLDDRSSTAGSMSPFAVWRRGEDPAPWLRALFEAADGDIVGPVETPQGWMVAEVLAHEIAGNDAATREAASRELFARWLDERRAAAHVAWYWHQPEREADE